MSTTAVYLDASALVKLAIPEDGAAELRSYLGDRPNQVTSEVGLIEVARAVSRRTRPVGGLAEPLIESMGHVPLDARIIREASRIAPTRLRTLDAIHLASAMGLGSALEAFVTYDRRLAEAAREAGLPVASPGVDL